MGVELSKLTPRGHSRLNALRSVSLWPLVNSHHGHTIHTLHAEPLRSLWLTMRHQSIFGTVWLKVPVAGLSHQIDGRVSLSLT